MKPNGHFSFQATTDGHATAKRIFTIRCSEITPAHLLEEDSSDDDLYDSVQNA